MKKTRFKDILRNILKQKVSYISIIVISMVAVTVYLGVNYSADGTHKNAVKYFESMNFRDFEITSTLLLTEEDMDVLRAVEGVKDVEGLIMTSGNVETEEKKAAVYAISLTERINTVQLLEGRLPQGDNECLMEDSMMTEMELSLGDTIALTGGYDGHPRYLKTHEFTVVGRIHHADHYVSPRMLPETRYLVMAPEAFDTADFPNEGRYVRALIQLEKPEGMTYLSDEYDRLVSAKEDELQRICQERQVLRDDVVRGDALSRIKESEEKLIDGKSQLDNAKLKIDDGKKQIADGERELADAGVKLTEGKAQYAEKNQQLADAGVKLTEGKAELDAARDKLADAKVVLDNGEAQLNAGKAQLTAGRTKLDAVKAQLSAARKELDAASTQIQQGKQKLIDTYALVEQGKEEGRQKIRDFINGIFGEGTAEQLAWAVPSISYNVDDPTLTVTRFYLSPSVYIDLNLDLNAQLVYYGQAVNDFLIAAEIFTEEEIAMLREKFVEVANERYYEIAGPLRQWDEGHNQYIDGKAKYQAAEAQYAAGMQQYQAAEAQYQEAYAKYTEGVNQYNAGKAQYEDGIRQYNEGLQKYNDAKAQYDEGVRLLAEGKKQLEDADKQYKEGIRKLTDAKKQLAEGEVEYAKGMAQYNDGMVKIGNAKAELADLAPCYWILLECHGNGGYVNAVNDTNALKKLGMTFSLLFIVVAALVIYATVGRIVDEQRTQLGTQKALGFYNREIAAKYLMFGLSAAAIGIILGAVLAYFLVEEVILTGYNPFYVTDHLEKSFQLPSTLIVMGAGLVLAAASVWLAISRLVKEPARTLMSAKAPDRKKKRTGKKTSGKSLYSRLILRNMTDDIKRVIITIVSIAGCCTLLVVGFSMNYSINSAISKEYGEILNYDYEITFNPTTDGKKVQRQIERVLKSMDLEYLSLRKERIPFRKEGRRLSSVDVISGDPERISEFMTIRNPRTKEAITLPSTGMLLSKKSWESFGFTDSGELTLYDSDMNPYAAEAVSSFDKFFMVTCVMSTEAWQNIHKEKMTNNTVWVRGTADADVLKEKLSDIPGFQNLTVTKDQAASLTGIASILGVVTVILIIAAGLMAYFVQMNLVTMYVNQKKRELTIMRVNGFTTKEVIRYALGESLVTTFFGIVLGIAIGSALTLVILNLIEHDFTTFNHNFDYLGWLYSALITIVYSLAVNLLALRIVKNLKLRDVA